jgi:hypothetical protein
MTKNFFKYKKGVGHYHSGAKIHSGMIDYTFLLPGKNDFLIEGLRISYEISNNIFLNCYISNSYKMTRRRNLFWFFCLFSFPFCFVFLPFTFSGYFRSTLCHSVSFGIFNLINFFVLSKGIFKVYFLPLFTSLELIVF